MNELGFNDIMQLISYCKQNGVTKLVYKDLTVVFGDEPLIPEANDPPKQRVLVQGFNRGK